MKIAIIGSSLSGILATEMLKGKNITLFEKGNSKLSVDKNIIIRNAIVNGNKSTSINEGIGGTSELWTGGLVRKYPENKISKSNLEIISRFFKSDIESLLNDTRYEDDFIFQKTIVLDNPKRGKKYIQKLVKRSNIDLYENCNIISINCQNKKIIIEYNKINQPKNFIEEYDYCLLSNGTIGFHQLLPNILVNGKRLLENNHTFKVATHPKVNIGYATSNRWEKWNDGIFKIKVNSSNFSYERLIFEIDNNGTIRNFALRLFSRRIRYMIKISKFLKIFNPFSNIKINLVITNFLDQIYCTIAKLLKLKEKFSCELFIADEFVGESFINQNKKNINLKCKLRDEYSKTIYSHIMHKKIKLEDKFRINFKIKKYHDWEITILHSHLCSTLIEENIISNILKRNKIIPLSCLELSIGYFNPMIESLINTQKQIKDLL